LKEARAPLRSVDPGDSADVEMPESLLLFLLHLARRVAGADLGVLLEFGRTYAAMGLTEASLLVMHDALEADPTCPACHFVMGGIYQGMYKFEEAIGAFEKTGELDPTHPLPKVAIGDTYMAMNKYKDALKYYEIAAAMPRKHGCAFVGKAHALYRMGRTAAGLRVAETAYEMAQTCNITSYKLGLFYLLIAGMTDRAIECLENCIKLDPDDHMAYRVLAEVYESRGDKEKASDYMTRADRIAVSPSSKLKEHWATVKAASGK
jgi:tetratricopeptide (TPR) repeat protein